MSLLISAAIVTGATVLSGIVFYVIAIIAHLIDVHNKKKI